MRRESKWRTAALFATTRIAICTIVASAVSATSGVSMAQSQSATQSILSRMAGTVDPDGHEKLTLTFAPSAPKFAIIGNDTDAPSIAFAATAKGPRASAQSLPSTLGALSLSQADTVLVLK